MEKERKQDDDRDWDAQKPKKNSSTHDVCSLHGLCDLICGVSSSEEGVCSTDVPIIRNNSWFVLEVTLLLEVTMLLTAGAGGRNIRDPRGRRN
jgi:hypothetical protein